MRDYSVSELFLSVQGEGVCSGLRAFFVRLSGCPLKCPWCDTKYAWEKGCKSEKMSAKDIACLAKKSKAERVVITGGEPCAHNLLPLVSELRKRKIKINLETSGVCAIPLVSTAEKEKKISSAKSKNSKGELKKYFDWIALSPKFFAPPKKEFWEAADEVKFVISKKSELVECAKLSKMAKNAKAVWIHPEWSKTKDEKFLRELAAFVEKNGDPFRLGWQLHKNYFVR